ncbi:MAG: hypothetical protein SW833_08690 [Cyanobacteriota bacterium]|nr:hypothetical protein [Cyanobacteriota bacterium]
MEVVALINKRHYSHYPNSTIKGSKKLAPGRNLTRAIAPFLNLAILSLILALHPYRIEEEGGIF